MNKILLNTIHLDEDIVIKKENGVKINNQSKSVEITENGSVSVTPDAGYTGLSKVDISVSVASEGDIAETDAGVCASFYEAGLCANPNYITKAEAALITDEDLETFRFNPTSIKSFNGFQYFIKITKLKDSLFYYQTGIESIELPPSLVEIGNLCFYACDKLKSIKLPNSLNKIGAQAFIYCKKLKTITSLSYIAPTVDNSSFGINTDEYVGRNTYNTNENTLIVPAGATGYDTGAWLDPLQSTDKCGFTIKYQGVNNQDKAIDIVENGTTEIVADSGYTGLGKVSVNVNVASSGGGSRWTGHADAEGLKAIGWTDEDIAYYQENGVNWNEEDDEYHKVTDDNKALYGVLTASNIQTYKDRIVYLPKIDTSGVTSMQSMFYNCYSLVSIPQLDTSNVTSMSDMFYNCYSLVSIPQLDTSSVWDMSYMFYNCSSLVSIPLLDTSNVTNISNMFSRCHSLVSIPQLDTSSVWNMNSMFDYCYSLVSIPQLDTSKVTNMISIFSSCLSLVSIPLLDTSEVTNISNMFSSCYSLTHINLKNAKLAYQLNYSALLSKESLLYLINNEATTEAITIKLAPYAYQRLAEDADVVAALANHPNISIAQ